MYISKRNLSGNPDPTAFEVITNVSEPEERKNRVIKLLKGIIRETGFELENRIVLRDSKTGEVFR